MNLGQFYFRLGLGSTDIARDIKVVFALLDLCHSYSTGVAFFFPAVLVGLDNLVDMLRQ